MDDASGLVPSSYDLRQYLLVSVPNPLGNAAVTSKVAVLAYATTWLEPLVIKICYHCRLWPFANTCKILSHPDEAILGPYPNDHGQGPKDLAAAGPATVPRGHCLRSSLLGSWQLQI